MAHPVWQVFLADSATMTRVADISFQSRDKQLEVSLNRPGSFTFNMPLESIYYANTEPMEYCVILFKEGNPVWSGPIWNRSEDFTNSKINLNCVGWFELLNRRFLTDTTKEYTAVDARSDAYIIWDLLSYANAQVVESEARSTWMIKDPVTPEIGTVDNSRTIKYEQWQNIGEAMISLTEVEKGSDIIVDPGTRYIQVRSWDAYEDKTEAIFGFNWGPHNVESLVRNKSAADMKNQWFVVGDSVTAEAHDTSDANLDKYNLHQEVIQLNEISDSNMLGAIANAELAFNQSPRITIDFTSLPPGVNARNVPSFFIDYNVGDKIYLSGYRHDAAVVNQGLRVFGLSLTIDDTGQENLSSLTTIYGS